MIYRLSSKFDTNKLCKIAKVSLSWYYKHKKLIISNKTKGEREEIDLELIKEISLKSKQKNWYRMITMLLKSKWIIMNHKKVLRLMNKYKLLAKIRRKNPYRQIMKVNQEHRTAENKLNREFTGISPLKKLWTDITYIRFKWRWVYLSIIKDMVTSEILSFKISNNLSLWIVHDTLKKLKEKCINWELNQALLHSDQWFHYTHPSFWSYLKEFGCIQSMSRKWNCIDNSPTESFFWHLKDEIDISLCNSLEEVEKYIENYILYYNNSRPQWSRKKMTPVQYRNHLLNLT